MKINTSIISEFKESKSKLLAVTKYFDVDNTDRYIRELDNDSDVLYGYGENRLDAIQSKNIPREKCHFIGNIQSRKLKSIVDSCGVIHSVANKKHLLLCEQIAKSEQRNLKIFLQLKLDIEKNIGFSANEIIELVTTQNLKSDYFQIIGISGMGVGIFKEEEKRQEFQQLINLRDNYFLGGYISAGTSRDYKIALDMKIDIIRVGKALYK